jgi:hypothetical protein
MLRQVGTILEQIESATRDPTKIEKPSEILLSHFKTLNERSSRDGSILSIDVDDPGTMFSQLTFFEFRIGTNDDQVTGRHEMCSGAIDAYCSGPGRTLNGISDQSIAIVDIVNVHLLELDNIRGHHQVVVDRHTAFVV